MSDPARAWFAAGVLMLANMVSYFDRLIITLLAPQIQADLAISDTRMSLLIGLSFALFYALMGVPIGWLVDRANRVRIIGCGVALWSAMTAASAGARSFAMLFAARMGVGIGEAALTPAAMSLIADHFPPDRRAAPTALFSMGGTIGASAAYIAGGAVIGATTAAGAIVLPGWGSVSPWQQTFLIAAVPGLLVVILTLFLREPARQQAGPSAGQGTFGDMWALAKRRTPTFAALYPGIALLYLFAYGLTQWAPTLFLRRYGMPPEELGPILGIYALVLGLIGTAGVTWLAGWLRRRGHEDDLLRALFAVALITCPTMVLAPLAPSPAWCLAALAPTYFSIVGTAALALTAIQNISPPRLRGRFTAFFLLFTNIIGLALGPLAVALLTDRLFADPGSLHLSLVVVGLATTPVALLLFRAGLKDFALARREAEPAPGAGT